MDDAFSDRLQRLRRELADLQAAKSLVTQPAQHGGAGTGSASDGMVEAVAVGGRLRSITIDPRMMRHSTAELAEQLAQAAGQALGASQSLWAGPALADPGTSADLGRLTEQLAGVQNEAARTMTMISSALADALAAAGDRSGMHGDPGMSGLPALLDEAAHAVREQDTAGTQRSGDDPEPAGRGSDPDGLVVAEVDGGDRVRVEVHPQAMRRASQNLAESTVAAVNAALDSRQVTENEARPESTGVPVDGLEDRSVAGMRANVHALAAIMQTIGTP